MQTNFSAQQLLDPHNKSSEKILRTCVHCGFCTATCPTYRLLGDELDGPRGRIYLIKDMLENGKPATGEVVKPIDRCLSCLSCMTTCPSGVHYMHLVDHARAYIEQTYKRPFADRMLRSLLAFLLPHRERFRFALAGALLAKPLRPLLARTPVIGARLGPMLDLAPAHFPSRATRSAAPVQGARRGRVVILEGCAQPVLKPSINDATQRLLARFGVETVDVKGEGCCGALVHHIGREHDAFGFAKNNIDRWIAEMDGAGLDAIIITASGCGTTVKDYGFMLRDDPVWAARAARVSALAQDVTEFMTAIGLKPPSRATGQRVAYHSACSMQHGQRLADAPKRLLRKAGFKVKDIPEGHICCGSAGTYNILQPGLAAALRDRKLANIAKTRPDVIATGNIGCITQLASGTTVPIVHTIELLDWATGGPKPNALAEYASDSPPKLERRSGTAVEAA